MTEASPWTAITTGAYKRWLRAHRPPFELFMAINESAQEELAQIGDDYTREVALLHGYAGVGPAELDTALQAAEGDATAEALLAVQLANLGAKKVHTE